MAVRTWEPTERQLPAEGLMPARFIGRIKTFIAWANKTASRLDRNHEVIPADPHGRINMRACGGP